MYDISTCVLLCVLLTKHLGSLLMQKLLVLALSVQDTDIDYVTSQLC